MGWGSALSWGPCDPRSVPFQAELAGAWCPWDLLCPAFHQPLMPSLGTLVVKDVVPWGLHGEHTPPCWRRPVENGPLPGGWVTATVLDVISHGPSHNRTTRAGSQPPPGAAMLDSGYPASWHGEKEAPPWSYPLS